VPISDLAGRTNALQFRLVSRGNVNAVLSVSNILIVVNPDIDGDGLTNELETALGTNPSNSDTDGEGLNDGDEFNTYQKNPLLWDSDGDGISDGQEVAAGTDPKSPAPVFKVTNVERDSSSSVTLQWSSVTNKLYRINRSLTPSRADYTTPTNAVPRTPPLNNFTDSAATNAAPFYWIELQ